MARHRELFRLRIDRMAHVQRGTETVPCHVVNLTEKGFQLRMEESFAVGDILRLEFALTERELLSCMVKVIYTRPPFLGAVIVGIPSHHEASLSHFIDEVTAMSLAGF